jgi:hypothetical protein
VTNAAAAESASTIESQRRLATFHARSPETAAAVAFTAEYAMPTPKASFHLQSI